jgi:hypothetical protein
MYLLTVKPGPLELLSAADGYQQVVNPLVLEMDAARQRRVDIRMRRSQIGCGDVDFAIPWQQAEIEVIAAAEDHLVYTANDGGDSSLYRIGLDGGDCRRLWNTYGLVGIVYANGTLYAATQWPGRLYRIGDDGNTTEIASLGVDWPSDLAFDGQNLWFLDRSAFDHRFGVCAVAPDTGKPVGRFVSGDMKIIGLAWGNGRLWVSSNTGFIYEVDPAKALADGKMESGVLRKFNGLYSSLSFSRGYLWGVSRQARRICRINVAQ